MGFLRRSRPGPSPSASGIWETSPDWAAALPPGHVEYLADLVQKELGRTRIPDPAMLRDFANAAELSLPNLLPRLGSTPTDQWPAFLHEFYEAGRAHRVAGEAIEARAQTFHTAVDALRIHWMRAENAPAGDVTIDGPIPETVEVLALDAGSSIRHVSERLFARWGVSVEEAVEIARQRVLSLPLVQLDWAADGHPDIHIASLESEGPYAGALLAGLDQVDPTAIGAFGTIVGAPVENAVIYRALDPSPNLRDDLVQLSMFAHRFAEDQAQKGFLKIPMWRRPDGRTEPVTFRISDRGELLDSHHPGFAGVLAALDPQDLLPVPSWAQGVLGGQAYTRFAGCVAASRNVRPDDVEVLGSALELRTPADRCRAAPFDDWQAIIAEHLASIDEDHDVAAGLIRNAVDDPDRLRAHLATWLAAPTDSDDVSRPLGDSGFVEVLGVHAGGMALPLPASVADGLGKRDELFEAGQQAIRGALVCVPAPSTFLSGEGVTVKALPSPTAAIAHLMTWLPDQVGAYGALVAVGDGELLDVLPVDDASVVLDLPALFGIAVGRRARAPWTVEPTIFWLGPGTLEAIHLTASDGILTEVTTTADIPGLVATLPAEPRRLPAGLEAILGPEPGRRFYGVLHAAVVRRLANDPAGLVELTAANVRDVAGLCETVPPSGWSGAIDGWLDEMASPRRALDHLTLTTDYAEVRPALGLRVARRGATGSELARDIGGGLAVYPTLDAGLRHRRVTNAMVERWRVDHDGCRADASSNAAQDPTLTDEPMFPDQPAVRAIYSSDMEREAVGTCLHLRYPGSRRGFVVSITHGSRAHYVRLDDPGALATIPTFANLIASIYREADKAADAHSSWLFWLTPDGRLIELFDVLQPLPPRERMPQEFVAMAEGREHARAN